MLLVVVFLALCAPLVRPEDRAAYVERCAVFAACVAYLWAHSSSPLDG